VVRDSFNVKTSLLLNVQFLAIEFLGLRARCALAAAAATPDPVPLLAEARRAARRLERINTAWARAYATPVRAQLDVAAGARDSAVAKYVRAAEQFDALEMRLHAAVARYRLSELLSGPAALTTKAASSSEIGRLGVKDAEAIASVLIPLAGGPAGRSWD
jgi:hypothetical protein